MKITKVGILLILLFTLLTCDTTDDDNEISTFPIINTVGSDVYSTGGVLLKGKIENVGDEVVEGYGFELFSNCCGFTFNVDFYAEDPVSSGNYTVEIIQGLYPDAEYRYTAFIRTEVSTYRGETLTFQSTGSATPVMTSCDPELTHIGDNIVLNGENFPTDVNRIELQFGDSYANVISASPEELIFQVPRPDGDSRQLQFSAYGKTVVEYNLLDLHTPVINDVSPSEAFFGETITLIGDHFNVNPFYTSCTIGGFNAEILSTSRNEVQVIVPQEVNYSDTEIRLYAQNQEVSYYNFNLTVPTYLDIPQEVYTEDYFDVSLSITSQNQNLFYIDGNDIYPEIIDDNTLRFWIPSSWSFEDRNISLKWILNDMEVEAPQTLEIVNPYIKIKDASNNFFPFRADYNLFTINDEAVLVGDIITDGIGARYLFKYDDMSREWINEGPVVNDSGGFYILQAGNEAYTYSEYDNSIYTLMNSNYTNNFVKINPETGEAIALANNTSVAYYGKGFSHLNKVYFTNTYDDNIWAYNIDLDSWEIVTTAPYDTSNFKNLFVSIFVDGDYAYFINGGFENTPISNEFWRLNLNNYSWEQLPTNPNPESFSTIYKWENELHVVTDYLWKYNLTTNTWTQLEKDGITSGLNAPVTAFIQNNVPYVIRADVATNVTYLNLFMGDYIDN